MERRFSPALSVIAFVGCCGLWYAIKPHDRESNAVLGGAFALPLVSVLHPMFGGFPALMVAGVTAQICGFTSPYKYYGNLIWLFWVPGALLYSAWPLFFRRYIAALVLFLFTLFYGWFSITYFIALFTYIGD
jgi:hypothetical protein